MARRVGRDMAEVRHRADAIGARLQAENTVDPQEAELARQLVREAFIQSGLRAPPRAMPMEGGGGARVEEVDEEEARRLQGQMGRRATRPERL